MLTLTLKQKRLIGKYIRANYNVSNIRFLDNGTVTASRNNKTGRVFVGWDILLLKEATERKGAY